MAMQPGRVYTGGYVPFDEDYDNMLMDTGSMSTLPNGSVFAIISGINKSSLPSTYDGNISRPALPELLLSGGARRALLDAERDGAAEQLYRSGGRACSVESEAYEKVPQYGRPICFWVAVGQALGCHWKDARRLCCRHLRSVEGRRRFGPMWRCMQRGEALAAEIAALRVELGLA